MRGHRQQAREQEVEEALAREAADEAADEPPFDVARERNVQHRIEERLERGEPLVIDPWHDGSEGTDRWLLTEAAEELRSRTNAERMTTYKQADGEPVWGEYGWVVDLEYFDDHDGEPVQLVKEVWVRESVERIAHHPTPCFCATCDPELAADNAADAIRTTTEGTDDG